MRIVALSRREIEVVTLSCQGLHIKQACVVLGIARRTFEIHRARALRKLGARNAAEMGVMAFRLGLVQ